MEKMLNDYLEKVEKHLKPMAISERVDIIREIKSEMLELQNTGIPAEDIVARLGDPKDLAKAYLGDMLSRESGFNWNRFLIICAFYSLVGFSGVLIIPCLSVIAPVFIACGAAVPVLAAIKLADHIFNFGIPYMENIGIVLDGVIKPSPAMEFFVSVLTGVLLYLAGRGAWRLLVFYCKKVSRTKSSLSI